MFEITRGKGFHLTFSNGWTVSVQFGSNNYCANMNTHHGACATRDTHHEATKCVDAEVAAWDRSGTWHRKAGDSDDVQGWLSADRVGLFIAEVMALPETGYVAPGREEV